ncbi:UDP-glucose 4-epimerase GalE [Pantoea sp. LS15]|uniref:UDP-glucose 4-epimerase GalE n=1 Tax=Enterobacterales TaxID=91347 RepID=UPI000E0ED110|nr:MULTISPECIES: UDP-glucose 4-epimerase GalE [Enterobacterales]NJQ19139.1 UDP-glucose 4-epimerase GalE [Pantoea sp. LS15]NKF45735.1 UDP-glucose 4-epimerase GalE [Pantoea sp. LS15]RDK16036.1 UDP-glucose 4-epimerase GalE [Enterobacter sp. 9-2]
MSILITGGAGYIGSHTLIDLLLNDYDLVVIDNLSNSSFESIKRVEVLSGKKIDFYDMDLRDKSQLESLFKRYNFECVIHFAGLKSVGESVVEPLKYYDNNLTGSLNLLSVMKENGVKKIIFSSSATVYGFPEQIPLVEGCRTGGTTNPYGTSKLFLEQILKDVASSDRDWNIISLRYFNPVGAHPSGLIGEDPSGIPNNLVPYITKVAIGKLEKLSIYGNDYPTKDGTGVRDFIHVQDLASGHTAALKKIDVLAGYHVFNLGTGKPHSVLELISCFKKVTHKDISFVFVPRRPGDVGECWSSPELANEVLEWKAKYSLEEMLRDSWNWQIKNPDGYK